MPASEGSSTTRVEQHRGTALDRHVGHQAVALELADLGRDQLEVGAFLLQRRLQPLDRRAVAAVGHQGGHAAALHGGRRLADDAERRRRRQVVARPHGRRDLLRLACPWPSPWRRACRARARSGRDGPACAWRIATVSTLLSSKVNALTMWPCSGAVIELPELPRLRVMVGEGSPAAGAASARHSGSGKLAKPCAGFSRGLSGSSELGS